MTESSDGHIWALDGEPTQEEILAIVEADMGEEYLYVVDCKFDATYKIDFRIDFKELYKRREAHEESLEEED